MTLLTPNLPQAGEIVGYYRIIRQIAKGGMGTVFEGADMATGERVAIKLVLPAMLSAHPDLAVRSLREAHIAQRIDDEAVVGMLASGAWRGLPYVVMEYVEGQTVMNAARDNPMDLPTVKRVVAGIARALEAAHAQHIVHRDIKPGNIMLLPDGRVKVLDFGLAKVLLEGMMSITAEGTALGSPAFMSPEQTFGASRVDKRADVWSLACVVYFLLTGERPFQGDTIGQKLTAVMKRDYIPVSVLRPELGTEIDAWFERAFARRIDDRFQSAGELAEAFEGLRAGVFDESITRVVPLRAEKPAEEEVMTPSRAQIDRRRGRLTALAVALAALCLVVLAVGAMAFEQTAHQALQMPEAQSAPGPVR